jgi:hypothetical protein
MHQADYDVHIVCSEVGLVKRSFEDVRDEIGQHLDDCLYFGVTAMTGYGLREAKRICAWVRKQSPETKIVWGGWHASLLPEDTLREPEIDFVVVGQVEDIAAELEVALEAGVTDFSAIDGLGWKDGDRLVLNSGRAIADIQAYSGLPYDLVDIAMFEQHADERMVGIITSVGCPLDCGFCADRAVYQGKWKRNGVEKTLELITKLQSVEDIKRLGRIYGEVGVSICFSTLVGMPHKDKNKWREEWNLTIAMIDELLRSGDNVHTAQLHVYTPYPGTPLFDKAVELGFKPPTTVEGWADVEMFTNNSPYLPADLSEKAEFVTTHILQLKRLDYHYYRGTSPLSKLSFGVAQTALKAIYGLRWKLKYFDHPLEMRIVEGMLRSSSKPADEGDWTEA